MKIEFDVPSMQHGARRAGVVATAAADTAVRVGSLLMPVGTPPDVAGELQAIRATLDRAAGSLGSQATWLNVHAQLAKLADSPLGGLAWLLSPPLLSPFPPPEVAKPQAPESNPWGPDLLRDAGHAGAQAVTWIAKEGFEVGKGVVLEAASGAVSLGKLSIALNSDVPSRETMQLPREKILSDYKAGVWWAVQHPIKALKATGSSLVSADVYQEHGIARGLGANLANAFFLFFGLGELRAATKGGKAVTDSARAAPGHQRSSTRARTEEFEADQALTSTLHPQRVGERDELYRLRKANHALAIKLAKNHAGAARTIEVEIRRRIEHSNVRAGEAERTLREAMHKTPGELAKDVGTSVLVDALGEPVEPRKSTSAGGAW